MFSANAFQLTLIVISTKAPLVTASFVVAAVFTLLWNHISVSRNTRQIKDKSTKSLHNHFAETESGLHYIRSLQWQARRKQKLYQLVDQYHRSDYHTHNLVGWLRLCTNLISFVLQIMVISLAIQTDHSNLTAAVSLLSLTLFGEENTQLTRMCSTLDENFGSLARISEFIQSTPLETEANDRVDLPDVWPRNGKVLFEKVSVWHNK